MPTIEEQESVIQQAVLEAMGMTFKTTANVKPKLLLVDMASGDEFEAPFNPTELVTTVVAKWAKLLPIGHTTSRMHYEGTESPSFPIDLLLWLKAVENEPGSGFLRDIQEIQRFLLSLMYPAEMASTVHSSAPPRVLVIWPNEVSMVVRVERVVIRRIQFRNTDLRSMVSRAQMQVTGIRGSRVSSEEVRETGLLWPGEVAF